MTNRQLIDDFESLAVSAASFHHADHVHLAFAYLREFSLLQALESFSAALKRFAVANGKPHLYSETITFAYFFLIQERVVRSTVTTWEEFASTNPDLLVWKGGILDRYYRETTLRSDLAKRIFIFPDKCLDLAPSLLALPTQRR
jgi:hypothetical protein